MNQTLINNLQWNVNRNAILFIEPNATQVVVYKMAGILYRPQCDKTMRPGRIFSILQSTSLNAFSYKKHFGFGVKIHIDEVVQLSMCQQWFRDWLGAEHTTSYCLHEWWPSSLTHITLLSVNELSTKICFICINHIYFKFRTKLLFISVNMIDFYRIPDDEKLHRESHLSITLFQHSNHYSASSRKFCLIPVTNYWTRKKRFIW